MEFKTQIQSYNPVEEQEISDKRVILEYIEAFPHNILLRSNEFAHLTSSGFIMNATATKVLMIHHNIYQTWAWTGGHADGDTDLLAIALKEAREETGVEVLEPLTGEIDAIDILPVWGHIKRGKYVSTHMHLNVAYILIADENAKLFVNKEETSGVRWIAVEDIEKYSNEIEIIAVYKKLIKKAQQQIRG